jgi:hypothetical protein
LPPPAGPARPASEPNLPFTGADLGLVTAFGFALLAAGWLLVRRTEPRGSIVGRVDVAPAAVRLPEQDFAAPSGEPRRYRVYVPGVGDFASIDEAEQPMLDRRWAEAGSRLLGARGRRRDTSG